MSCSSSFLSHGMALRSLPIGSQAIYILLVRLLICRRVLKFIIADLWLQVSFSVNVWIKIIFDWEFLLIF